MNEEDLRRALHDGADRIEVGEDSWHRLQSRLARRSAQRSPVRSMLRPAIAIVVFAALFGGLLFAVRHQPADVPAVGKAMTGVPRRILAATPDGWLVRLDTRTGKEIGRFVAKVAPGTTVGVSPDGRTAFFTGGEGKQCRNHRIETRPIEPGPGSAEMGAGTSHPSISPDGRYLAYYRCRVGSDHPDELVLRDLSSGSERAVRPPGKPEVYFGSHLAFEADSSHVILELIDRGAGLTGDHSPRPYQLDLVGGEALPGVGVGVAPRAFLGWYGTTDSFVGRLPRRADPETGRLGDMVMQMAPRDPAKPAVVTASRLFFSAKVVQQLASDLSGRRLLFVADNTLYRWSRGDKKPTKIRDGIAAAAWIPDPPTHPPVPAPPSIVVERPGVIDPGPMVVLDAATGSERGFQVGNEDAQAYVSATADGTQVVSSPATPTNCVNDGGPGVRRRDMSTNSVQRIVSGAIAPVVSARNLTAYGIVCDGHTLGFTDLRTEANFRAEPLGDRKADTSRVNAVEPLSWSPDGTRLLYRLRFLDDTRWHYYVGAFFPAVPSRSQRVEELPIFGVGVTAATFLDGRHIAFAQRGDVRVLALERTRKRVRAGVLFSLRGTIRSLIADSSGQHVLVVAGDTLLRWDRGGTVRIVSDHVVAAAWLGGPG